MTGGLTVDGGTLLVGVAAKTARVLTFDLGGRPQPGGFSFRDAKLGRSSIAGLSRDRDRRTWVADDAAHRVRIFSPFGLEVGGIPGHAEGAGELPGILVQPVDVLASGHVDDGWVAVACAGARRRAVQLFDPEGRPTGSVAALGEPQRAFENVVRLATDGRRLLVAEAWARRVQVFQDFRFRFGFQLRTRGGEPLEPSAVAALPDGRMVVGSRAPESAVDLVDASGRALLRLAEGGEGEGSVSEPLAIAVVPDVEDPRARVFVLDSEGLRVQVFDLEGRCLGAFAIDLATPSRTRANREEKGGR